MNKLRAELLGPVRLGWGDRSVTIGSRKALGLVCMLALRNAERSREEIADIFWQGGLANVRQAVYQIRRQPGADEWLSAGERIGVAAETDVEAFEAAVAAQDHAAAIALWRGPFLGELDLADSPEFMSWLEEERQRLTGLYRVAVEARARKLEEAGNLAAALGLWLDVTELDSFDEAAVAAAMRLEYLSDRPDLALARFESFARTLARELGAEPGDATRQLAETIRRGNPLQGAGPAGLPERLRLVLQAVLVASGGLTLEQLARVLGRDPFEVGQDIDQLQRQGMIDQYGQVALAAESQVRRGLADSARTVLEGRTAEQLEAAVSPEQASLDLAGRIALHLLRAGLPERAARWFLREAELALAANEPGRAVHAALRACWTGDPRERFEGLLHIERASERTGDERLQNAALDEAATLAWDLQDDAALARAALARARAMVQRHQSAAALQHAREALAIAERTGDAQLLAMARNAEGGALLIGGQLGAALEAYQRNSEAEDDAERYRALSNLGVVAGLQGDHEAAYRYFDRVLTMARKSGQLLDVAASLNNLSVTAERLGAYSTALKHLHEARQLFRRGRHRTREARTIYNLSVVYARQGAFGPAWNSAWEVTDEAIRAGESALEAFGLEQAADIAAHCGDHAQAMELFARGEAIFEALGDERRMARLRATRAALAPGLSAVPHELSDRSMPHDAEYLAWLTLETALRTTDPGLARELLDLAGESVGAHRIFVREMALARIELLESAGPLAPERAAALALAVETGEEFGQMPLACLLLACDADRAGEDPQPWLDRMRELLDEQARGLPAAVVDCLRLQPTAWLAGLSSVALGKMHPAKE